MKGNWGYSQGLVLPIRLLAKSVDVTNNDTVLINKTKPLGISSTFTTVQY
jgi:hypothetical protein